MHKQGCIPDLLGGISWYDLICELQAEANAPLLPPWRLAPAACKSLAAPGQGQGGCERHLGLSRWHAQAREFTFIWLTSPSSCSPLMPKYEKTLGVCGPRVMEPLQSFNGWVLAACCKVSSSPAHLSFFNKLSLKGVIPGI